MKNTYNSLFNKALNGGKGRSNIFYRFFLRIILALFAFSLVGATTYHVSQYDFSYHTDCRVYIFAHYSTEKLPIFEAKFEEHKKTHPKATFYYYDSRSQEPEVNELAEKFNLNYTYYRPAGKLIIRQIQSRVVIETHKGTFHSYSYKDIDDLDEIYQKNGWSFK